MERNRGGRPKGSKKKLTKDLEALWDAHAKKYGHPIEFLFQLMTGAVVDEIDENGQKQLIPLPTPSTVRAAAAGLLLRYRYAMHGTVQGETPDPHGQYRLTWEDSPLDQPAPQGEPSEPKGVH